MSVSILGLRSYIHDDEVKFALMEYGVLKSDVIRLKYKADHDLAGMENGNRLVKMVLDKPSLPYSMRIGGEWCRIIHNNQQPVCLECKELGHTRKKCPMIRCRVCKQLGHMSFNCDQREEINQDGPSAERDDDAAVVQQDVQRGVQSEEDLEKDTRTNNNHVNENQSAQENYVEDMDHDERIQGLKRQHTTDSDSDGKAVSARRQRLHPPPNIPNARRKEKQNDTASDLKSPAS